MEVDITFSQWHVRFVSFIFLAFCPGRIAWGPGHASQGKYQNFRPNIRNAGFWESGRLFALRSESNDDSNGDGNGNENGKKAIGLD